MTNPTDQSPTQTSTPTAPCQNMLGSTSTSASTSLSSSGVSVVNTSLTARPALSLSSSSPSSTNQSTSSEPVTASTSPSVPDLTVSQSAPSVMATPSRETEVSKWNVSPIDKYLQLPTAVKTRQHAASSSTRAMTGARVLTSAECLAIIKEKEMKKKQQEEDKENRKKLREEKKQREEEKKKGELRLQREKEREKQREKKAEEKARKAEERARQSNKGATSSTSACAPPYQQLTPSLPKHTLRDCTNTSAAKIPRVRMEDTDTNKCCVCLQSFEEDVQMGFGVEWIQCACERWLHEDCIIDCVTDSSGKERLCPFCT